MDEPEKVFVLFYEYSFQTITRNLKKLFVFLGDVANGQSENKLTREDLKIFTFSRDVERRTNI